MTFTQRMLNAAMLKSQVYEEVEADKTATGQALGVVVLSSIAGGIGAYQSVGVMGLVLGTLGSLLGWYVWAYLCYVIGTKLLPEAETKSDHGELLRTLGFAASPGILRVFGFVPGVGPFVAAITAVWMLIATVIGVRQALDYKSTLRAVGVCLIGWLFQTTILLLVYMLLPNTATGM